eukprot:1887186-Rhodomonas_salina.2
MRTALTVPPSGTTKRYGKYPTRTSGTIIRSISPRHGLVGSRQYRVSGTTTRHARLIRSAYTVDKGLYGWLIWPTKANMAAIYSRLIRSTKASLVGLYGRLPDRIGQRRPKRAPKASCESAPRPPILAATEGGTAKPKRKQHYPCQNPRDMACAAVRDVGLDATGTCPPARRSQNRPSDSCDRNTTQTSRSDMASPDTRNQLHFPDSAPGQGGRLGARASRARRGAGVGTPGPERKARGPGSSACESVPDTP